MKTLDLNMVNQYIFLMFLCIFKIGFGQIANNQDNSPSYQLNSSSDLAFMSITIVSAGEEGLSGSFYLNEEFLQGTVLFHNTKQKIKLPVRYNAGVNEIEAKKDGSVIAISPSEEVEVLFDNKSFIALKNPKNGKLMFVERLVNGNFKLYDFFKLKIRKAPSDASLLDLDQKDEIEIRSNLYFQTKDGVLKPLPKRKKELNKTFDSSTLNLLKKENPNLKKKEDAVTFFNALNKQ